MFHAMNIIKKKEQQMSAIIKTISYLKRNGIKNTCDTIMERLDSVHLEPIQKELKGYEGCLHYANKEREANQIQLRQEQMNRQFSSSYSFSIIVPAYETNEKYLIQMIDSVMLQTYTKVELVIADASKSDHVEQIVKKYVEENLPEIKKENKKRVVSYDDTYPKLQYIRLEKNDGIANNTNVALEAATGDYIGLLDHDDALTYDALYEVMQALEQKDYDMIYTNEDKGDGELSRFFEPNIKYRFNLEKLLSNNYICHFTVIKAPIIKELTFRKEYDGAQDYDMFLRVVSHLCKQYQVQEEQNGIHYYLRQHIGHVDQILYHWRCHENSTAANPESKRYAYEAGKHALQDFCDKNGMEARVEHSEHLGYYKLNLRSDLWKTSTDIGAFCGKVTKGNKVVGGPVVDGREILVGLKKSYSGYMNQGDFSLMVDEMDERAACFHPRYHKIFEELAKEGKPLSFSEKMSYVKEQGDVFVFLHDFDKQEEQLHENYSYHS